VRKVSFFGRLLSKFGASKKEGKIVLLGASGAGKTTLVRYLETGEQVVDDPKTTLGIDIRRTPIDVDGWSFKAIDVGGQKIYQKTFWALGVGQADAVIYVLDGTTKPVTDESEESEKWKVSKFQFEYMLGLVENQVPLLIVVNKQDLEDTLSTEEAFNAYNMNELVDRSFIVLPTSAKYGDGVQNAMEWLVEKIEKSKN